MKMFSLLVVLVMLCGCQTFRSGSPRLSRRTAVNIARQVAIEHKERLQDYRQPSLGFYPASDKWIVSFTLKTPYTYGHPETCHYFAVTIDDKTGSAEYKEGQFK